MSIDICFCINYFKGFIMLDDILGNVNEQQEQIEAKLKGIDIVKNSQNNEIQVVVNGKKDIVDITINKSFEDNTELEDILVLTLNEALKEADSLASQEAQSLLNSMMPGGLSGLFG